MKANDTQKEYLSPKELASKLGMALKTITNWTQLKRIPGSVKIGGRWRYHLPTVEKRLLSGKNFLIDKAE